MSCSRFGRRGSAGVLADYDRVLRQRNTLLKSAPQQRREGPEHARHLGRAARRPRFRGHRGAVPADRRPRSGGRARVCGCGRRRPSAPGWRAGSASTPPGPTRMTATRRRPELGVLEAAAVADDFRAALVRVRRSELDRGLTLVGPHRDDLVLELNGMPARITASHGESWSFALALRLGSAELLRRESVAGDPVLILDDVFAELDEVTAGAVGGCGRRVRAGAHHRRGPRRRARAPGRPRRRHPGRPARGGREWLTWLSR